MQRHHFVAALRSLHRKQSCARIPPYSCTNLPLTDRFTLSPYHARRDSKSRWLDSYADFDRSLWATHSVARPWELARKYPNEIAILDKKAFFWP